MKISACNQIKGTVVKIQEGAVNGHATIEDEEGVRISGSITNESIEALGLKEGGNAVAIIKATASWSLSTSNSSARARCAR